MKQKGKSKKGTKQKPKGKAGKGACATGSTK
jgi:hypothetical protein